MAALICIERSQLCRRAHYWLLFGSLLKMYIFENYKSICLQDITNYEHEEFLDSLWQTEMRMLTIAIVDDNNFDLEECNRTLHSYAEEQHRQIQTRQFQTEGELLSQDQEWIPDCVFLDIVMEDNTPRGIEIGTKINERWPYCQIVYLTDYIMYASDVYRTRHTYFVTKQDFDRRADEIFEIIEASNRNRNRRISLRTVNRSTISLYTKDILLFERKRRDRNMRSQRV